MSPPDPDVDVVAVAPHSVVFRIHRTVGVHVLGWNGLRHYGPLASARFDPHEPPPREQQRAVLYAGLDVVTCLAEVFQSTRQINRHEGAPYLTGFRPLRTLRLLDLTGRWPTRAGCSQAINTGRRDASRSWARSIRGAFPDLDGLWYRSSMNAGKPCVALFDTVTDAMPERPIVSVPLAHPGLAEPVAAAADALGYRLL